MYLSIAYTTAAIIGLFGTACNADPQLVLKDRSYYAYGYEGDVTEGGKIHHVHGIVYFIYLALYRLVSHISNHHRL